ncbi:hydantoinase/oxoprolinase family protein [Geosporobacter ferrireducens]|uniref:Hydantoin utilization protein A n=1 Tax=Geosporobacter ferrireducens TaxID=1424294 RepID=A0A1D8GG00_9FIRM|nr:hydantoinase/oxoprolinase family protein [Geosporobacter ferrireducens]AOT69839.1 hydantoin utilization protein A [Geosporobacter ferrireducens]
MSYMIGVDVGGTFTDFSIFDTKQGKLSHYKQSSTPEDPSKAIVSGILHVLTEHCIKPEEVSYLAHGTTVATNALIEKKGAKTGLITTKGFKDLMEIGWQKRPSLYDLLKEKPESLIPPGLKCEVEERILYDGTIDTALDEDGVREAARYLKEHEVKAIAVCTLFSFINPVHELRIKEIIKEEYPDVYITTSSELVPEFREYSRMSTTVLNVYLGPVMEKYVNRFEKSIMDAGITVEPYVTQSNGSVISIAETVDCPIKTAVSGPSAGVIGASYIANQCKIDKIITFDMGGTSIDVSLIENGKTQLSNERLIEGYPARIPMIDIVTVGAGGGSIGRIDEGGALKVGPQSAGATPGPACYMRGGVIPTVTDANIVLGKLNQKRILGGRMKVDLQLAQKALTEHICSKSTLTLKEAAAGVISVVNSNMIRAIRMVSVERGYDPREFTLMAFGGAGPLHACEVAQEMGIHHVLIPPSPGTLCSLGLLMADTKFDISRSNVMIADKNNIEAVQKIFSQMIEEGNAMLDREQVDASDRSFHCAIECRYERQNYEIPIEVDAIMTEEVMKEMIEKFHKEHFKSYGYFNENMRIQMVNYRVSAVGTIEKPDLSEKAINPDAKVPNVLEVRDVLFEGQKNYLPTNVYQRNDIEPGCTIEGPAIIEQMDSTTIIPPRWLAYTDGFNNIRASFQGVKKYE